MDIEALFQKAYKLPQGRYYKPTQAHVTTDNTLLLDTQTTGITNATSSKPILGSAGMGPCIGMAIYNRATKTLVVRHDPFLHPEMVTELIAKARKKDTEPLEFHFVGGELDPEFSEHHESYINALRTSLATVIAAPNTTVKTFDVLDKPHPSGFAVDARNGRLICETSDIKVTSKGRQYGDKVLGAFNDIDIHSGDFDGTLAKFQIRNRGR